MKIDNHQPEPSASEAALHSFLTSGEVDPESLEVLRSTSPDDLMQQAEIISHEIVTDHPSPDGVANRLKLVEIASRGTNPALWFRLTGSTQLVLRGDRCASFSGQDGMGGSFTGGRTTRPHKSNQ